MRVESSRSGGGATQVARADMFSLLTCTHITIECRCCAHLVAQVGGCCSCHDSVRKADAACFLQLEGHAQRAIEAPAMEVGAHSISQAPDRGLHATFARLNAASCLRLSRGSRTGAACAVGRGGRCRAGSRQTICAPAARVSGIAAMPVGHRTVVISACAAACAAAAALLLALHPRTSTVWRLSDGCVKGTPHQTSV